MFVILQVRAHLQTINGAAQANMKYLIIPLLLLCISCTQTEFNISSEAFSQENMAHAAQYGTIYLTSATQDADHNCDENPSNCCAAGYHLCTFNEMYYGGRQMESIGTGRDQGPYNTRGDVAAPGGNDCSGWSSTAAKSARVTCTYTTGPDCDTSSGDCSTSVAQWCCSP